VEEERMAELKIVSSGQHPLKPLVEAALANELRLLEAAIRRGEERLEEYEKKNGMPTDKFVDRFERDEFEETLERAEWIGEYRLVKRLREKAETLRGVHFAS
jgi:hypothetical protein